MRIRLTKPLAQTGRVIPPGVILSNAPPNFMRKLAAEGRAVILDGGKAPDGFSAAPAAEAITQPVQQEKPAPAAVATAPKGKQTGKAPPRKKGAPPHG